MTSRTGEPPQKRRRVEEAPPTRDEMVVKFVVSETSYLLGQLAVSQMSFGQAVRALQSWGSWIPWNRASRQARAQWAIASQQCLQRLVGQYTLVAGGLTVTDRPILKQAGEHLEQLEARDRQGQTALYRAVAAGKVAEVGRLLSLGCDPNAQCGVFGTPLREAVWLGRADLVQPLLEARGNPNASGASGPALVSAVFRRSEPVLRLLLNASANPNVADSLGETPLTQAANSNDAGMLRQLLAAKADVNLITRFGRTALGTAAFAGHCQAAELLIAAKADVEGNRTGKTPLMEAACRGCIALVQQLLDAKAETNRIELYWGSALTQASRGGHDAVVKLLLQRGAKPSDQQAEA
jgi:uncharacterized protein